MHVRIIITTQLVKWPKHHPLLVARHAGVQEAMHCIKQQP